MQFSESKTMNNLMLTFAGECQSHTRYLLAANQATKQQLPVIRQVFEYTAKQELTHAQLVMQRLTQNGITRIHVQADYPLAPDDLAGALAESRDHEFEQANSIYPAFAETASQEGFTQEAELFRQLAEIERGHAERFAQFAQRMQNDALFRENAQIMWLCMNCGHLHFGTEPPKTCPVCGAVQGFAVRGTEPPQALPASVSASA